MRLVGKYRLLAALVIVGAFALASFAHAANRVALVIGISAYDNTIALANPTRDAKSVADKLKALDFDVILRLNSDQTALGDALLQFEQKLKNADAAMFYFAGHGIQVDGKNYLLSSDARVDNPYLIDRDGIRLDRVLALMRNRVEISIAMIDACRNNPLANTLLENSGEAGRSLSLGRGLARIGTSFGNSLVAFATAPGAIALDGTEQHSPFTAALLKHIGEPDVEISTMLKRVTRDVMEATTGRQRPEVVASMAKEFFFVEQNITVEGDLVMQNALADTEAAAGDLLKLARTMPAGEPRIASLRLVQKRYPDTTVAAMAGVLIDVEAKQLKSVARKTPEEPFDRTKIGALSLDRENKDPPAKATISLSPEDVESALGLEKEDVQNIQTALNSMGYDLGTADGAFGARSRKALRLFQLRQRIPQTGYLNNKTVTALLKTFDEVPKTYDGKWQVVISRKWLVNDPNGSMRAGQTNLLTVLNLVHRDGRFDIVDFQYRTITPQNPFNDFRGSISKSGKLSLTGKISTHFGDKNHKTANLVRLKLAMQLPSVVTFNRSFEKSANRIDGQLRFDVEVSRRK